ncbi:MAG: hypothetical protein ACLGGX_11520 [Bdellovibrionia bacterium]
MKKIALLIGVLLSFSSAAHASILIEPYANVIISGKIDDADISGSDIGARLGWGMAGFSIGVDAFLSGTHTYKDTSSTSYTPSFLGVFLAYEFPILVRGYASYAPSYYVKKDDTKIKGTNTRIGVQYTGLPFVAIGLEMQTEAFDKIEVGSTPPSNYSESSSITSLVVSIPFSL